MLYPRFFLRMSNEMNTYDSSLSAQGEPINTPPALTPNPSPRHMPNSSPPDHHQHVPPRPAPPRPVGAPYRPGPPSRPAEPPRAPQPPPSVPHDSYGGAAAAGSGLFSSIKGGAGSFFKNLKDTSSKVMQTVQQTITRTDLDISAITSRILVMPCPSEGLESAYRTNNIDDVKIYIESRYAPAKVSIYNLASRTCARLAPPVRTVEGSFIYPTGTHAPLLHGMYSLVEDMFGYLSADPKSIIIIQSADNGRAIAATMVCALLIYAHLVTEPEDAMQIFAVKRQPPNLNASQVRYLYYLGDIVRSTPHLPHFKAVTLTSVTCCPVPRMTKARDGCRLYVEVHCQDKLILTTIQEYEKMRYNKKSYYPAI